MVPWETRSRWSLGGTLDTGVVWLRRAVARDSGAPETVFIGGVKVVRGPDGRTRQTIAVTVLTPTGRELAVCAHGFMGAICTLWDAGQVDAGLDLRSSAPGVRTFAPN